MAEVIGCILDTSFFVAAEQRRPRKSAALPDGRWVVSVVTLAELRLAVLNETNLQQKALRLRTLEKATRASAVGIDENVAFQWAVLRSAARSSGQSRVNDLWIAATALALGVPVVTQDAGFQRLAEVGGPSVILL